MRNTLYKVRRAEPGDAKELARLRWEYQTEDQGAQSQYEFRRQAEAWFRNAIESGQWVVAVASSSSGSLCGCMYLQRVGKVPIPGEIDRAWGYITNAYVAAAQRGQELGRELLDLLIVAAREQNLEFLIVWPSEEAVPFYQRAGFRPASEVHARADDYPPLEMELCGVRTAPVLIDQNQT